MEKPRWYHGDWSAWGGPKAKTRWAAGPKGFWLLYLPGPSIHHDTPKDFPYFGIILASQTAKEGFLSANGLLMEYDESILGQDKGYI